MILEKIEKMKKLQREILKLRADIYEDRHFTIKNKEAALNYIRSITPIDQEFSWCFFLDAENKLIEQKLVGEGSLSFTYLVPREVVKHALAVGAQLIIVAHNHPSGDPTPSEDDKKLTKKLLYALKTVDIELLDHVVIGAKEDFSFFAEGLIDKYAKDYAAKFKF